MATWDSIKVKIDRTSYDGFVPVRWVANPVRPGSAWDEWLQLAGRARRRTQGENMVDIAFETKDQIDAVCINGERFDLEVIRHERATYADQKRALQIASQDSRWAWSRVDELDRKHTEERVHAEERLDIERASLVAANRKIEELRGEVERTAKLYVDTFTKLTAMCEERRALIALVGKQSHEIAGQKLLTPPESTPVTLGMLREILVRGHELRQDVSMGRRRPNRDSTPQIDAIDEKLSR